MSEHEFHTVPVVFPGTLPIPVGHRIHVFYLMRDVGTSTVEIQEQEPLVHDLTTDIWFGSDWQLAPGGDGFLSPRNGGPPAPGVEGRSFRGTVRACAVATFGMLATARTATTLHVEVE